MNIHFDNIELFKKLTNNTIFSSKIGSHTYNLNNEQSDIDYLYVYIESKENLNSFMWSHHQLQYKKDNVDYNFTSIQSFIRNMLTGDSTINLEILFSDAIDDTKLHWLYEYRKGFINYNIIKSYLGMAKRDFKMLNKKDKNFNKKASHFVRGVIFAQMLLEGDLDVSFKENKYLLSLLSNIKNNNMSTIEILDTCSTYETLMNELRKTLNDKLNNGEITKYGDAIFLSKLDETLKYFVKTYEDLSNNELNYSTLFYDSLENGPSY